MESLTETTPRSLHLSALPLSFPSLHLPFRVCCKQAWAAGFLWFHLVLVQPTLAQLRKAGMSRTGTLRVKALTRRLRSSVRRTTSLWSLTVPSVYGAEVVKSICRYVKHQRGLHTFLIRHEVFSLVFAVVETAGQNHIVVISLGKKKKRTKQKTHLCSWKHFKINDINILPHIRVLTCCPEVSSLRKAMDSSWFPLLVSARRHGSLASNCFSRKPTARRAFSCTARK